jgi:hypothetical protein
MQALHKCSEVHMRPLGVIIVSCVSHVIQAMSPTLAGPQFENIPCACVMLFDGMDDIGKYYQDVAQSVRRLVSVLFGLKGR